jgi:methyltransferase
VIATVAVFVFASMIAEAVVASRHDRRLRTAGAEEPRGDVYAVMQVAYPAAFLIMLVEGAWREVTADVLFRAGLLVFVLAKGLKYWAIAALGSRWTFRVLVPPGAPLVTGGPYRWVRHPNYVAVAGELLGVALAMHAMVTGPIAVAGFGALMLRRIRIEDRALGRGRE